MEEYDVPLTIRLSTELRDQLNVEARKRGLGRSALTRMILIEWVNRNKDLTPGKEVWS
jgi:hypothetical protein